VRSSRNDPPNRVKPGTVNRELDTLKSIFSKAVEWKYLVDSPARGVKRFRVQNRRMRILSVDEQRRLRETCEKQQKLQALLKLALITGARIGELLTLAWEDCQDGYLTFWQTKNGRVRGSLSLRRSQRSWPPGREFTHGSSRTRRQGSRTQRFARSSSERSSGRTSQAVM
jgi:integrase